MRSLTVLFGLTAALCSAQAVPQQVDNSDTLLLEHPQEQLDAAKAQIDAFESTLHTKQTRSRRRASIGPKRASPFSRAYAIETSRRIVDAHNKQQREGKSTYTMAMNELSDLSPEEYRSFLKAKPQVRGSAHGVHIKKPHGSMQQHSKQDTKAAAATVVTSTTTTTLDVDVNANATIPKEINWLTIENGKYVTPIKNQGTCGSCWAFSGVAVVESRYAIENNVQASPLSVEQVLSCSAPLDHIRSKFAKDMVSSSEGCDGGMPFLTYEYMSRMNPHGVSCADSYPYVMATTAGDTVCQSVGINDVAVQWKNGSSSYVAVASSDENALLRAVMSGPVSANLDATGDGFKYYESGIYDAKDCSSDGKEVNHAVVVAGFGETEAGEKYWVIRNTWGTMWGENGNMRIARGSSANGPCNLYLYSSYPVNLSKGSASASSSNGATCAVVSGSFSVALPMSEKIGFDLLQGLLLFGMSIVVLGGGMMFYWITERQFNIKEAAGNLRYEDNYRRWLLPTREQIANRVTRRRPTAEV
ncbi:Papain-like cysteine protease c1, partial [Globisporangium splendens]